MTRSTFTVTVTNVNEAPEITTNCWGSLHILQAKTENTATSEVIETFEADDVDDNSVLTWDLQGVDAGDFTITKNADGHGDLKFARGCPTSRARPMTATDNEYNFTVRVRDNRRSKNGRHSSRSGSR